MPKKAAISATVNPADLARFRRDFAYLCGRFPKESGQAARKLGRNIMVSMRRALLMGRVSSRTLKFSGGWPRLNPLYVLLGQDRQKNRFGGALANNSEGKGSPIGYFYDAEGLSLAIGMFRSVPGMRNAKAMQKNAIISNSAAATFDKFQRGGIHKPLDAHQRRGVYLRLAREGRSQSEIAMARRELHKGWNTPSRNMIDPMAAGNKASWFHYLKSQISFILRKTAPKGAVAT